MIKSIVDCPIFKGVSEKDLEKILSKVSYQIRKFSKNELILTEGEKSENLVIIVRGSVRGEMLDFKGKTIKIEDVSAPRPIALAFLFGKNNFMPVTVSANMDSELLFIPKAAFLLMMQQNDRILENVLGNISARANFLSNKIKFLKFTTIKSKLAAYLLDQERIKGDDFICSKTQKQLAEYFGVRRPSVARSFGELEKDGVLSLDNKHIIIHNLDKLRELV
jgi:CRP-like cAMP-binding protein